MTHQKTMTRRGFLTGLGAGKPAQPDFRAALATQRVCDAVLASAAKGQWTDVVKD